MDGFAVELCDNGALRVLYQFEEILPAMPMAAAESDLFAPLISSEAEHAKLCGLSDADGGAFELANGVVLWLLEKYGDLLGAAEACVEDA